MYHQLSKVTGRLVAAKNLQSPLFPVAPIALQRAEPPTIQYTASKMSTVTEAACPASGKRSMIPGTNIPFAPVAESVKKEQAKFQADNDKPVFLKGGPFDQVLYRFTLVLCAIGIVGVCETIYSHAVPKK